jgi:hypothetical protein
MSLESLECLEIFLVIQEYGRGNEGFVLEGLVEGREVLCDWRDTAAGATKLLYNFSLDALRRRDVE